MKRIAVSLINSLAEICKVFTPHTLALDGAWYPESSWRAGFNRRLPCNKRLQRKAHARRSLRRARRLGQA